MEVVARFEVHLVRLDPQYPTRVSLRFGGKQGQVVLDQIRTVDRVRLVKRLGRIDPVAGAKALEVLAQMFAP